MRRVAVAAVVSSLVLASCAGVGKDDDQGGGSNSSDSTAEPSGTLSIAGFSGEDEVAQSRIAAFKQKYPKVTVKNNKGDLDPQQFLTAVSSGNPPDVAYMDRKLIGTYATKGAIVPLDDCISKAQIDKGLYRESALRSATVDGKVYGIPEFYTVTANLIDNKALKAAGLTPADIQTKDWDALEATTKKLVKLNGGRPTRIGFDPKLPDSFPLWAQANGAELIKSDGAPNLNDPKAVEALTFAIKLVNDQGGWSNFKTFRDTFDLFGAKNQFIKGQLVAFPIENWYVNVLTESIPNGLDLQASLMTDRQGKPVSTLGGSAWVLHKGAKNPDAACRWAQTMTATDTWMKAAAARMQTVAKDKTFFTGLFTGNKPADDEIKAKYLKPTGNAGFDAAIKAFYDTLDVAQPLNPSRAGSEIDAAWQNAVGKAVAGQASPQSALDQAQSEAQKAFDSAKQGG